ncbi:MAG: diguanylate cyclase, partial [Halioglobus sp.]|nr:diguanylate cyclase [Halioglobus sp.]
MSIAARITALFVAVAMFFTLVVTTFLTQRDYHRILDAIVAEAPERVRAHPQVQLYVYNERKLMLDQFLAGFLDNEAVEVALAYNPTGRELGREAQIGSAYYNPPSLQAVRKALSVAETGLAEIGDDGSTRSNGFWSSVFAMNEKIHLTTPVFSPINPARPGLQAEDFTSAWARPLGNQSLVVMGYVHLVLDRGALLQSASTAVARTFIGYLLFTLLTAIGLYIMLSRITVPVARLAGFAEAVRAGEFLDPLPVEGDTPIREITKALNDMVEGRGRHVEDIGAERKLLRLKAEHDASELSARQKALEEANAQIDAAKEQLHRLANFDRLTSLPNQRLFEEQLGLLLRLSARENKPLALLNISIDGFARINESLGRMAGDYVLKVVGKRLQHCLRSSDVVALTADTDPTLNISRFNGDEFAVMLNHLSKVEQASLVADRITKALSKPMLVEGHEVTVQPNIGIASGPTDGSAPRELLDAAATALHTARQDPDHAILFYDSNMAASKRVEIELESALRKAIDNNELTLHYQPLVDTGDGSIICA